MYRYIDPADDTFLQKDKTYQRIKKQVNPFISNLKSEEDKQIMSKILSNCYHKYRNSIRTKSQSDIELLHSAIMALLIEQSNEIERIGLLVKTTQNKF